MLLLRANFKKKQILSHRYLNPTDKIVSCLLFVSRASAASASSSCSRLPAAPPHRLLLSCYHLRAATEGLGNVTDDSFQNESAQCCFLLLPAIVGTRGLGLISVGMH